MSDRDLNELKAYREFMDEIKTSDEFIARTEQHMRQIRDQGEVSLVKKPKAVRFLPYMAAAAACAVLAVSLGHMGGQDIASDSTPRTQTAEQVDHFDETAEYAPEAEASKEEVLGADTIVNDISSTYGLITGSAADAAEHEEEVEETVTSPAETEAVSETSAAVQETAPETVQIQTSVTVVTTEAVQKVQVTQAARYDAPVQNSDAAGALSPSGEAKVIAPENGLDMDVREEQTEEEAEDPANDAASTEKPASVFSPSKVYSAFAGHDITITDGHGRNDSYTGDYADSLLGTLTGASEMTGVSRTAPENTVYTVTADIGGKPQHIYVGIDTVTYETEDEHGKVYITYRLISVPTYSLPAQTVPTEQAVTTVPPVTFPPDITDITAEQEYFITYDTTF
ncbi:MAG: hypothetical protein IJ251_02410 [Oscillospiraceae bacterium]|nr:hypothetical protein [Oscillospiraceae bacterium]